MLVKCLICHSHISINTITHYQVHSGSKKHQSALEDMKEELEEAYEYLKKYPRSIRYNQIKNNLEYKLKVKYCE